MISDAAALEADPMLAELNAYLAADALAEPATSAASGPRIAKILVVDDCPDYRDVIRCLLEHNGYEVVEAINGIEGLQRAISQRPDLVLLDFDMPLMNGYELAQELRADFDLRGVPIILFTGKASRDCFKGLPLHISEFLAKPVSNFRLLEAVHCALGGAAGTAGPQHMVVLDPRPLGRVASVEVAKRDEVEREPGPEAMIRLGAGGTAGPQHGVVLDPLPLSRGASVEAEKKDEVEPEPGPEALIQDSSLIDCVNQILLSAVRQGASDIHIEPQETEIVVRVRLNGALIRLCVLPADMGARVSARIKILSSLVITERRRPQDGQFRIEAEGKKVEFRVSILPGIDGEKIVMRILGASRIKASASELGFGPRDLDCFEKAIQSPNGLILVTGPTGSGKTTTLYTMLAMLNKPDVNIMTVEDPVEYRLPGITQVQIKPAIGLTFDTVLRSLLRQDPDIMLVGEIRDSETAEIAVRASITGHLVFSTLHTNSAPATIARLTQMGVKPFLAAASLKLVVAQRLVKRLCPACKIPEALSEGEKNLLTEEEQAALREVYRGAGCAACGKSGYVGRAPIFEVMPIRTAAMRQLILNSNDVDVMTELAVKEGMSSLRRAALALAASGETSMSEALKIALSE